MASALGVVIGIPLLFVLIWAYAVAQNGRAP
jgi:hypothetical protein